MVYDLSDNVDTVFTKIDDFQDLCTILKWPKTEQQLINYAYLIFQRVNVFQDYLIKWNKREEDPSWTDFQDFIVESYQDLENVDRLTIANSSMNLLQEIQHLKDHNTQVANNIKEELRNDINNSLQAL